MEMGKLKELVLNTVKHLSNCALTPDIRLYDELKKYIEEHDNEVFEQDGESINASCKLLRTITKTSVDNERKQFLMDELKRESGILLRSLWMYTKVKQYPYTPLQILLKLEILFDSLLDHSKVCHDTYVELSKCIIQTKEERLVESTILVREKNRSMLLHELADAPLDDIITFLAPFGKTFYDFYNYDRLTYVVFRLRNLTTRAERSTNVYDKLCFFINSELKQKYQLDIECFAELLLDQFESIDDGWYRKKLIDFVENVFSNPYKIHKDQHPTCDMVEFYDSFDKIPFTFVKFFDYIKEDPFLIEKDQSTFGTLFEIYCKKLAGILQCAVSEPPPETASSCQFEDPQTTKSANNRGRNKKSRRNNLIDNTTIAEKNLSQYDSVDDNRVQTTKNEYRAEQYYSAAAISGDRSYADGTSQYKSERFQNQSSWYDNDYPYTHQPRRRTRKQKPWIEKNY